MTPKKKPAKKKSADERLIDARVRRGHNREQSKKLLADLKRRHSGANLHAALVYQGFKSR